MSTLHPLDISELRLSIARYLDLKSLCTCATVCRAWHQDIQPLVWRTYRLSPLNLSTRGLEAWVAIMNKNAHWIRCLQLSGVDDRTPVPEVIYDTLLKHCRGLVHIDGYMMNINEWICLKKLIQVNTGLQSLSFGLCERTIHDYTPYTMFTQPVGGGSAGHSQLKSLTLECWISAETLERILLACPALEEVNIWGDIYDEETVSTNNTYSDSTRGSQEGELCQKCTPPIGHPLLSSRVRSVSVREYFSEPAMVDLFGCLPSLKCLEMPRFGFPVSQRLRHVIERGCLRTLKTISLCEYPHLVEPPQFVLPILSAIPQHQLQKVTLWAVGLEELKCVIDHQHQSLQSVAFYDAPPETMIALLAGCPHLRTLRFLNQNPVDVHQLLDQPWTCASSLEELSAKLCLPPATEGADMAMIEKEFMKRLGQCTRLRKLLFGRNHIAPAQQLRWSLAHGLDHLASLSRLEVVCFGDLVSFEVPELQFMRKHWPRLKSLPESQYSSDDTLTWLHENWPDFNEWPETDYESCWDDDPFDI